MPYKLLVCFKICFGMKQRPIVVQIGQQQDQSPDWNTVTRVAHAPLNHAAYMAHKAALRLPGAHLKDGRRFPRPSPRETIEQNENRRQDWDQFVGEQGAVIGLPREYWMEPTEERMDSLSSLGDGNCHWYGTAQALSQDWRTFARIKADIRQFYIYVLSTPGHPRYRMYVHMELQSKDRRKGEDWGRLSLARCLHVNHFHASHPQHRPYYYLPPNQVIADYYDIELIELGHYGDYKPLGDPNIQNPNDDRWRPRARGRKGVFQIFQFHTQTGFDVYHIEPGLPIAEPP